jgi:hypothetical protein
MRASAAVAVVVVVTSSSARATRLVVAADKQATLVEAGATSAKVVATIKLPSNIHTLVWIDRDPVVLLDDGRVGAVTPTGFVAIATPPSNAFDLPRPGEGVQKLDSPDRALIASTAGELWLGRCDWGFPADGGIVCENWVYARLGSGARLIAREQPADANPSWEGWPSVLPAPNVSVTFAKRAHGEHDIADDAETMTCRFNGTTLTFPDDPSSWTEHDRLHWISRDPPLFVIDSLANGYAGIVEPTAFEGCSPSGRFVGGQRDPMTMTMSQMQQPAVTGFIGPTDLFVLASDTASAVFRNGKELLALPGGRFVAFEPARSLPRATDAFALLEREIAGDASMFAADATVLAPVPRTGPPKLVKHADARIERFETEKLGDAMWLAAELVLDGKTYRTLQLVDASGRVVVATFAPLKSLGSGGAAPSIPSPSPAGPLASFAASPVAAKQSAHNGTAVFGTELGEHAIGREYGPDVIEKWSKLVLALDAQAREVHTASYGYAIASVTLGKSRMIALVIGSLDPKHGWDLDAIHYLGL